MAEAIVPPPFFVWSAVTPSFLEKTLAHGFAAWWFIFVTLGAFVVLIR